MKKPEPETGLVIRYDFLWSHERDRGLDNGVTERPCVTQVLYDQLRASMIDLHGERKLKSRRRS